tara:strand:- start:538 stop:1089 length:552 start_codon:yes stop_codon:yes gene_type:complete
MDTTEFLKKMHNIYLKDKSNFIMDLSANEIAFREFKIDGELNEIKHFKLLEEIINKLYYEELSNDYYNFLQNLLFTILEENSISLTYKLKDSDLRNILSLLDRKFGPNIFYKKGEGITLSNTQVHMLINKFHEIQKYKTYSRSKHTKHNTQRPSPYNKTARGKKKRKNKKSKKKIKIKNIKRY